MAKERAYKEAKALAQTFISFDPSERWRNMPNLSDGSYYVSDKGRVMRLNPYGIFNEINRHLFEQSWYASIQHNKGGKPIHKRHNIARMVLRHFTGGDTSKGSRRFIYVDGDRSNLKLSNLRWKTGFANGVDFWYLRKLHNSGLPTDDRIIKSFLLTDNQKAFFKLISEKEGLMRSIDYKRRCEYFQYNDYMDFTMLIRDRILQGEYKPSRNNYKKPNAFTNFVAAVFINEAYKFAKERKNILPLLHENMESHDLYNVHY